MNECRLINRMPDGYSRDMHHNCCAACLASNELAMTLKGTSDG